MKKLITLLLSLLLFSCSRENKREVAEPQPECLSYAGKPLYAKVADPKALAKSDSIIGVIETSNKWTEEDFIEVGKQLVASNRYKRAVENYSEGLAKYPNSFKLLRYRGHRYITLRQLDKSIADLTKAEDLIRSEPDVWEYDLAGKPSTYQHQIWYHIGVYHFLEKSYSEAAAAFEKSLAATKENDGKELAGTSDWLYNSYSRSGQKEKAQNVLKPFTLDFNIDDKDYIYYRRVLLFNGIITPDQLINKNKPIAEMTLQDITKLYALANWRAYRGEKDQAMTLYKKILESKEWPAFAYACAEKEVEGK